ncbi:O-methyltransferase [Amaricoccus sp.]|uniref:O-methyltransferase n=1 Tax=Amaricoccus sp. TaxID=1872485 RepID=UPI001B787A89|nr:O-methyltransferase [Amaricoccus sp.]MBP7001246.1 O-methyltransferase [Amaricoccus sp.]
MSQAQDWARVDSYIADALLGPDPTLDAVLAANAGANLPAIDVSRAQGRLLQILARMVGARRILEIGTLGGFSTICLARALPADGRLVTLEADPRHAEVALANIAAAGLGHRVELRLGKALDTLPALAGGPAFDLVFIDADKPNNAAYLDWALRLARPGSVILVDNVVRSGRLADRGSDEAGAVGSRRLLDRVAAEPRLEATVMQTVGEKGWDGILVAVVIDPPRAAA